MKELPTDDPLFGKGTVRADGRKVHDAYLLEVKKPAELKYPGDFYHVRATIPAAEAFRSAQGRQLPAGGELRLHSHHRAARALARRAPVRPASGVCSNSAFLNFLAGAASLRWRCSASC